MSETADRTTHSDDESEAPKIKLIVKSPLDRGEVEIEDDSNIKRVSFENFDTYDHLGKTISLRRS